MYTGLDSVGSCTTRGSGLSKDECDWVNLADCRDVGCGSSAEGTYGHQIVHLATLNAAGNCYLMWTKWIQQNIPLLPSVLLFT